MSGARSGSGTRLLPDDFASLVVAKVDGLDEPFVAEVVECVVADVEIVLGHDTESADGGECSAILAVQFVDAVTINDKLALLAAWQIEVVHQTVARVVAVPVALVVHAGPAVVAISLAARITPSSVKHRSLLACVLLFGLSVKTPWQSLRGVVQGGAEMPGRFAATFSAWSCGNLRLGAILAIERWGFGPRAQDIARPAADQKLLRAV